MTRDILTVAGLIRQQGEILLVRQQGSDDPAPVWALPGGVVEPGELLIEALVREVRKETGLEVLRVGRLLYVAQLQDDSNHMRSAGEQPQPAGRGTAFVFEIAEWRGELGADDPDALVMEPRFWSREAAIFRLEEHPERIVREPILAYLQGEDAETTWLYRREGTVDQLAWPIPQEPEELDERTRRARAFLVLGCLAIVAFLVLIIIIGLITLARPYV
ncbi:MAG TPA: NUDIX hydrolase [Chloroflexota bacterium]